MKPLSDAQLFDLYLMGMAYLKEDKPHILARPGSSIFGALQHAAVISEGQRRRLGINAKLISAAMLHSETLRRVKTPPKSLVEERIAVSEMYILTIVRSKAAPLQFAKFFGPQGYSHVLTDAGLEYASNVAPGYAEVIDQDRFMQAWKGFCSQQAARQGKEIPERPNASMNRYGEADFAL